MDPAFENDRGSVLRNRGDVFARIGKSKKSNRDRIDRRCSKECTENAEKNGIRNVNFMCGDAAQELKKSAKNDRSIH